ncbi:hypothetical protein CTA2_9940 [Colletotrichum tanaceti]|uniref:Aminoglycoside phosphotransferase domain-containing protein n=1 Tax=Colletotrichum tanaceti TaxID=1306861 RepID=A0A4V6DFX7_9PEZI|nr:hypothetical protein CTA2_9940 [Colletotrichum tanaceti]TKW50786.1 hypothetical protein CTA1_11815 [Colletotrichum tanaceti]
MTLTQDKSPDWPPPGDRERLRGQARLIRTNWEAIRNVASQANDEKPCQLSAHYRAGGNFLARQIVFQDGSRWVARVQLRDSTTMTSRKLRIEIDTTILLGTRTKAPVPRIFTFELDDANSAHAAFVLMESIPGNTVVEEAGDYEWNSVPADARPVLYATMAPVHVQIASARLPKIGAVARQDGGFTVGPIPGLGGPFDTAASFIEAWATRMKFPGKEDEIRQSLQSLPPSLTDEILEGIRTFPARLARLASSGKYFTQEGPFPVRHADLFHSNIIVTTDYHVLGVIDWEGSYTMPWELVDTPRFLSIVPRLLNPPEKYDQEGNSLDPDVAQREVDVNQYVELVRAAEEDACTDNKLSRVLADRNTRDLGALVHLYSQAKLGFYGRALEYFENT